MAKFSIPKSTDGVGNINNFQTHRLGKFEVSKLNEPYRLSLVWWPVMFADYKGPMSVDMFLDAYREFREAQAQFASTGEKSDALDYFSAPQVVARYQGYDKNPNGAKYIVARSESEVEKLGKVYDSLGLVRPEMKERINTYVVQWQISNKLTPVWSAIFEDDYEPEVIRLSMTKNTNSHLATLMQAGKSFVDHDVLIKATTNKWIYNPTDAKDSTFFKMADVLLRDPQGEKAEKIRKVLQKILDVVADHTEGKRSAVDVILDELGKPYTPEALKAKLKGSAGAAASPAFGEASGISVPDPTEMVPDIDVDSILSDIV